jgi:hypothetical protein
LVTQQFASCFDGFVRTSQYLSAEFILQTIVSILALIFYICDYLHNYKDYWSNGIVPQLLRFVPTICTALASITSIILLALATVASSQTPCVIQDGTLTNPLSIPGCTIDFGAFAGPSNSLLYLVPQALIVFWGKSFHRFVDALALFSCCCACCRPGGGAHYHSMR